MPGVDWTKTLASAVAAAEAAIGADWSAVQTGATAQIQALISVMAQTEADIAATPPTISASEYSSLKLSSQRAIEGVLQTYAAIGIVAAEQAASAAVNVVVAALKTAYPLVGFL
jgi:hypothetical protein